MPELGTRAPYFELQIHQTAAKYRLLEELKGKRNFGDFYVQSLSFCVARY